MQLCLGSSNGNKYLAIYVFMPYVSLAFKYLDFSVPDDGPLKLYSLKSKITKNTEFREKFKTESP